VQHRLASRLVYRKVRDGVGGRLRLAVSGGAPLATELAEFFHALDILILEGYGQSECTTACTFNRPGAIRFGTVGPPLPRFEVRIAPDGEVLVRGPTVFAGYLHDEEATREVLDEGGWLHTGDIGELDSEGFLTITDRKRDLIVTAGAKNVAPQNLEHALTANRLIADAVVVGDRRPYLTALLTLDEDEARAWARRNGREGGLASIAADGELRRELQGAVDRVNAHASRHARIRRFAVLERGFSAEDDEITPTLKLKRRVIERNFAREIDALYAER
jgi:long-chain acyl-CoA synthetase